MDCLKMKEAGEYNMKSRCQHFLSRYLFYLSMGNRSCYSAMAILSFKYHWFPFSVSSSSCPLSSPPVHPMWQGPLAVPGGDRQSPIDIVVRKSVFDSELKPLVTEYNPETCQQIWNNGYSFLVEYDDTTDKSSECSSVHILFKKLFLKMYVNLLSSAINCYVEI